MGEASGDQRQPAQPDLRSGFADSPIGMAITGRDGRFLEVNRSLCTMLGYTSTEMLTTTSAAITNASDQAVEGTYLDQLLAGRIRNYRMEKRFVGGDGRDVWVSVACTGLQRSGQPGELMLQVNDLTGWKRTEADLVHRAFHDTLTDLPNRALLMDRMAQALARAGRHQSSVALLFIDLDHFKIINDHLGHDAGDQFLGAIGARLRGVTRSHDTVARLGGDEFVMLCEGVGEEMARVIAARVVRTIAAPVAIGQAEAATSASVGVALASGDRQLPETLVEQADRAMYLAKSRGGGRYEVFGAENPPPEVRVGGLAGDLRRAISEGELRLVYQPQVELETGRITGFEALVRWAHPERGTLLPAEFIPAAERSGLILDLGRWVLGEAINQAVRWREASPDRRELTVSINVAAQQLEEGDFGSEVARALRTSGLPPASLRLEITGSAVLDAIRLAPTWDALRALGVRVDIDNFATAASSFRHLKALHVDMVTIDRSFVAGLGTNPDDSAVVEAVVNLAGALHLQSIAEGVETAEQAVALRTLGCTFGQGYYFSPPRTPEAVGDLIDSIPA